MVVEGLHHRKCHRIKNQDRLFTYRRDLIREPITFWL
ncbi:hypothetical protein PpBr36_02123 [Pyricularia pennisetigena]|nr:hypothetical protein PpBr36_02123 [Pyricularia pennisetigena]TLS28389.1 hypothetical protein PpBr36_02123 [Pyricularia pennisetigena]